MQPGRTLEQGDSPLLLMQDPPHLLLVSCADYIGMLKPTHGGAEEEELATHRAPLRSALYSAYSHQVSRSSWFWSTFSAQLGLNHTIQRQNWHPLRVCIWSIGLSHWSYWGIFTSSNCKTQGRHLLLCFLVSFKPNPWHQSVSAIRQRSLPHQALWLQWH